MRTDKIRKYLIPNIPYLFILWACLKRGTAYRLAAGLLGWRATARLFTWLRGFRVDAEP